MQLKEVGCGGPLGPRERAGFVSFAPAAASDWRGSVGLLAARYRDAPAPEVRRNASSPDSSSWASDDRLARSTSNCTLRHPWHNQATGASHGESKNGSIAASH